MDLLKGDDRYSNGYRQRQDNGYAPSKVPAAQGNTGRGGSGGAGTSGSPQTAPADAVKVRIPADADEQAMLNQLQQMFRDFHGNTPVLIYLQNGKIVKTSPQGGVHPTIEFFDTVAELVGRPNIKGKPVF